jgi:hypothetical protein
LQFNTNKGETEMEVERQELLDSMAQGAGQLAAVAAQLERTAAAIEARLAGALGGEVPKVVAAVEGESSTRLAELEARLQALEQNFARQIGELRAQAGGTGVSAPAGRKTLPMTTAHLLAKHGIDTLDQVNAGALDAALTGLSLEQRIAVKSQLMRAGLLG